MLPAYSEEIRGDSGGGGTHAVSVITSSAPYLDARPDPSAGHARRRDPATDGDRRLVGVMFVVHPDRRGPLESQGGWLRVSCPT